MSKGFWLKCAVLVALPVSILAVYQNWLTDPPREDEFEPEGPYRQPPPVRPPAPLRFTDVSASSGIDYQHHNGASLRADGTPTRYMPETMGPGVALFDYDGDERLDIFVTNSASFDSVRYDAETMSPRLYRNLGAMKFQDVTRTAGLEVAGYGMGVAVADVNGDGLPDLFLTRLGGNALYHNQGNGVFDDVSARLLPKGDEAWSTAALLFDADGDSDMDMYVANYVQWSPGDDVWSTINGVDKSYALPTLYPASSSRLLLQQDGRFEDATRAAGMINDRGKSLGAALWDFNADGRLDIVVANDTQPHFLYLNQGGGSFVDGALAAGIAYDENGQTRAGMGIDVADVGNDQVGAIAIGNFSREPVSLYRQSTGGYFRESTHRMGVAVPTYLALTFGLVYGDFDLDGWQDLLLANGHIEPGIGQVEAEIAYRQPLILLGNDGGRRFDDWSTGAGLTGWKSLVARGMAAGDLDDDGDLDVVVVENNGPVHVLRNDLAVGERGFLRVHLHGKPPNTDAIGATIYLVNAEDGSRQQRMVRTGGSYLSQSELTQTFGVPAGAGMRELVVSWPNGKESRHPVGEINRTLHIVQGGGKPKRCPTAPC